MPPPVTVRDGRVEDARSIAALSDALGYPAGADAIARRLRRLLARPGDKVLIAESESGQAIGWIHGSEQDLLESERRCEILGLIVDEEHRLLGVGRRLVEEVEEWAKARGSEVVSVRSNILRAEAHPFYERLGYERLKTQHAYRKRVSGQRPDQEEEEHP